MENPARMRTRCPKDGTTMITTPATKARMTISDEGRNCGGGTSTGPGACPEDAGCAER